APSSRPVIAPKPNDQRIIVVVSARTVGTLEAPSSLPISAWAAIARASRAKAMVEYTLNTIWWAARTSVPSEVAVSTVARSATRNEAERTNNQEPTWRSEEHTSELQSRFDLVCRLLLENKTYNFNFYARHIHTLPNKIP